MTRLLKRLKARINKVLGRDVLFHENKELKTMFLTYNKGYILGSAPSIDKLDLGKLDKSALFISMGNFHEHKDIATIKPRVHIFAASHPPISKKILKLWFTRAEKLLPVRTIILVEARDFEIAKSVFESRKIYKYAYGGNFPIDFTKRIIPPTSVAIVALQFGYYIGLEEMNLLGIDHDWQTKQGYSHFYKHDKPSLEFYLKQEGIITDTLAYKGRQSKDRLYRFYTMYKQYELFNDYKFDRNFKIYNADPLSEFDVFEKRNYNSN